VKAEFEALLATVDEDIPVNFPPCDISKQIQSFKSGKACDFVGIPNECLRHLPSRLLVHLTHLFNHCLWPDFFPAPLPKPSKDPKFPRNLRPISLLSTTGKLRI
jgi:hypothetical protein